MHEERELQPAHRVYLGEIFVFIFVFAGAMSLLVGSLRAPLIEAAVMVGISALFAILIFLWMIFTTPVKKNDTRYPFLFIGLTPALLICLGYGGYHVIRSQNEHKAQRQVLILDVKKEATQPNAVAQAGAASALLGDEIAAFEETLAEMHFKAVNNVYYAYTVRRYERAGSSLHFAVAIEAVDQWDFSAPSNPGTYKLTAWITNHRRDSESRYFDSNARWPDELSKEFRERWEAKLEAKKSAAHGK